jgi:hypothetical protein
LLGEDVERLVAAAFAADDVLLQLRRVQWIVTELEKYPVGRAQRAARRALYFASYELSAIRSILRKGLDLEPLPNEGKPKCPTVRATRATQCQPSSLTFPPMAITDELPRS